MTATTKCLAVDDHPAVRHGLGLMFGDTPDLELVGHVDSGEEVVEAVERLRPEVVIMDVRLPGIDGISAVKRLAEVSGDVKTVMFSAYGDKRLLSDAIAAGARGYVMKGSPPEDLLRAIRTVVAGKPFVDPSLSPALLMSQVGPDAPLSERER
jgi:DNA-binding NarL/FixJ family response regulator